MPEELHTDNIMQTEQAVFRNVYVDTYLHITAINEKRGHAFERARRTIHESLEGGKGRVEML